MKNQEQLFLEECENFDYASVFNNTFGNDVAEQIEYRNEEKTLIKKEVYGVNKDPDFYKNLNRHHIARLKMMVSEEKGISVEYSDVY